MVTKTQKLYQHDVLKWLVHQGYCLEAVSLNNGDVALEEGDSILGHLAFYTGSAWKILDDGDGADSSSIVCPILHQALLTADVAGDAALLTSCLILRRGPALVHKENLTYDADLTEATIDAAMLANGIRMVTEEGVLYTYDS